MDDHSRWELIHSSPLHWQIQLQSNLRLVLFQLNNREITISAIRMKWNIIYKRIASWYYFHRSLCVFLWIFCLCVVYLISFGGFSGLGGFRGFGGLLSGWLVGEIEREKEQGEGERGKGNGKKGTGRSDNRCELWSPTTKHLLRTCGQHVSAWPLMSLYSG